MLYAMLCYHDEDVVCSWTKEEDDAVMAKLAVVQEKLTKQGRLGPVARLLPTTAATTLRKDDPPLVLDGPFAETKEQLLGFYVVDCDEPRRGARRRARARRGQSRRRLRDPARSACSSPASEPRHDRPRLDRRGADRRRGPRRSARCCAISATWTPPRRPSRTPACAR